MRAIIVFDIDGVIRDVSRSYRRAIADTVEHFTQGKYRPTMDDIDQLKTEGIWNNDWEASRELTYRYFRRSNLDISLDYDQLIAFFQACYRGKDTQNWDGYITTEPILLQIEYLELLNNHNIQWGFFSGATRGSAEYILKKRLGLEELVLIAMEDAPGKPDPTGLLMVVEELEKTSNPTNTPVIYVGDTVADMYTVTQAQAKAPERPWIGVGIVPPHLHSKSASHQQILKEAGASVVFDNVQQLTPQVVEELISL